MKKPEAILFDLDGVLINSEPKNRMIWIEVAKNIGIKLKDEQIESLKGMRRTDCAKKILDIAESNLSLSEILLIHQPIFKKYMLDIDLIEGSEKVINICHSKNIPIGLVTSSSENSFQIKASKYPFLKSFQTNIFGDNKLLKEGKPYPYPYLLGAKELRINPSNCWVIEDSISGANAAIRANCVVWIYDSKNIINKNEIDNNAQDVNFIGNLDSLYKVINSFRT